MKILAIEASGLVAGCALLEDGQIIGDYNIQFKKTHSQTLLPMMEELRKMTDLKMAEIDAIALTKGPGSFTGLRIGAATAKGIGLALEKPLIPVSTLGSMAYNFYGTDALICPMMDARRATVFTGIYEEYDKPVCRKEPCAVPVEEIVRDVLDTAGEDTDTAAGGSGKQRRVIFTGDGADAYRAKIEAVITGSGIPCSFAPAHMTRQRAASTAALAYALWQEKGEGCFVSADDFRPEYLKAAQAERERAYAEKTGQMDALAAGTLLKNRD